MALTLELPPPLPNNLLGYIYLMLYEMGDSQSDSQSTFQNQPIRTALSESDERVDPSTFGSTRMRLAVPRGHAYMYNVTNGEVCRRARPYAPLHIRVFRERR
eukprot:COSAG01_NODE_1345_length_10632_cov_648.255863_2_plen_102_part_00